MTDRTKPMRFRYYCLSAVPLLVTVLWAIVSTSGLAQPPAEPMVSPPGPSTGAQPPMPSPARGGTSAADRVAEAAPIFYVRDKNDRLVPVPDVTFEEYDRWWNRKEGGGDLATPAFAFSSVSAVCEATDDQVAVRCTIKGRITAARDGYSRVPLGLANAFLQESPSYDGPGNLILEFQPNAGGYVAWLQGPLDSQHTVTLNLLTSVRKLGGEHRTRLELPLFPAHLTLSLAMPNAQVEVEDGTAKLLTPSPNGGSGTRVEIDCNGGPLELRWRRSRGTVAQAATVLEASCAALVRVERIEGRRRIRGEANLRVFTWGGPIETFDVRFPPGMEYTPTANPNFSIERLVSGDAVAEVGQVVRVRWQGAPTSGPIELRLLGDSTRAVANGVKIEAAGFEILDAARQWGHVDFVVDDEYAIEWVDRQNVRRVRDLPSSGTGTKTLARFDYDRFPYSLGYRVAAQPARVFVDPTYLLYVRDKQVVLDATLNYTIQGSAGGLKIDLSGWILDNVGPSELVSYERGELTAGSPLTLLVKPEAFTASPPLQIRLQAHRDITGPTIVAPLPRLLDSNPAPAVVAVYPADNVELTPRADDIAGMVPEPSPPQLPVGKLRQKPWYYRERAGETAAQFVGDHRVRERLVSVKIEDEVAFHATRAEVRQTLEYRIDYEPVSHLRLLAPKAALNEKTLTVHLGDEVLPFRRVEELNPDSRHPELAPIIVDFLEPRGEVQTVRLRYSIPLQAAVPNHGTDFDLPLASPEANQETTIVTRRATVTGDNAMLVEAREGAWRVEAGQTRAARTFTTDSWSAPLPLTITRLNSEQPRLGATIRRAWLQTWLTGDDRRDHAALRLIANESVLRLYLPLDADPASLLVTLDGEAPSKLSIGDEGVVLVGVPEAKLGKSLLLELWYRFQDSRPAEGWMAIGAPRIDGRDLSDQFFWQLIVPRDEHLLLTPASMTPVQQWFWRGYYWERCAMHDVRFLERWIGANSLDREAPSIKATNQYLFSSLGVVPEARVLTAQRGWLLLLAGGAVLIIGLSLLSFPRLRQPAVLFAASVVIVGLALRLPELSAFVGQAAVVGLALVLLGRWLEWALGRRYDRRTVVRGGAILAPESKSTELQYHRRPEGSSRGTTESLPGPLQISHAKPQL